MKQLNVISDDQLHLISGGHDVKLSLSAAGLLTMALAVPHAREFVNYVGHLSVHGFSDVKEEDYFTRGLAFACHGIQNVSSEIADGVVGGYHYARSYVK